MSNTDLSKANEIWAQLGGNRFMAMTGAKDFLGGANELSFRLPRHSHGSKGITHVKITIEDDLYTMVFLKVRGTKITTAATATMVGVGELRETFTYHTGLDCTL